VRKNGGKPSLQESGCSSQAFSNLLLSLFPIKESSLAFLNQALPIVQQIFLPLWYCYILLSTAEIVPECFHSPQFLLQCHSLDLKLDLHMRTLL